MVTDTELLRQYALENSQPAFAELVRRHLDLVYSVALRKVGGDAHAASDVAQAVFIALARQARSLMSRPTLAGWLYVTSQHQAAQWVRAEHRRHTREHEASTMNEIFHPPEIDWHQLRPVLDETLQALSETEREAILLRYFEKRPYADIGRAFLVSEDAARMRVDRALEKLRALLTRRGVSSTAAALAAELGQQIAAAPASLAASITQAVAEIPAATGSMIFMRTTQLLTGGVAAVAIAAAVIFSREANRPMAEAPVAPPPGIAAQVPLANAPAVNSPPAPAPTVAAGARPERRPATREEREPREPADVRRATFERQLASYRPLLEKLNLTPDQQQAFNTLLAANLQRHSDLREFARTQGARPSDPDVDALDVRADAELASQIRATLGDSVCAAFEHFNEVGPMRELAHHLAEALAASPDPLSPAQAGQLVEILAQHSRAVDGRVSGDPRVLDIEAAVIDAQRILTPPQIAALRQLQATRR